MQGYLIAFSGRPKSPDTFLSTLVKLAAGDGVDIVGGILTSGPGCYNVAIMLPEPNQRFAEALALALMPAKVCETTDPRLIAGEFKNELED